MPTICLNLWFGTRILGALVRNTIFFHQTTCRSQDLLSALDLAIRHLYRGQVTSAIMCRPLCAHDLSPFAITNIFGRTGPQHHPLQPDDFSVPRLPFGFGSRNPIPIPRSGNICDQVYAITCPRSVPIGGLEQEFWAHSSATPFSSTRRLVGPKISFRLWISQSDTYTEVW